MTIRELADLLRTMDHKKDAFVALFKADGTSKVFDIASVSDNNGNAQLDIHEET